MLVETPLYYTMQMYFVISMCSDDDCIFQINTSQGIQIWWLISGITPSKNIRETSSDGEMVIND